MSQKSDFIVEGSRLADDTINLVHRWRKWLDRNTSSAVLDSILDGDPAFAGTLAELNKAMIINLVGSADSLANPSTGWYEIHKTNFHNVAHTEPE